MRVKQRFIFGEWLETPETLDLETVQTIMSRAPEAAKRASKLSLAQTYQIFDRLGQLWSEETFAARQEMAGLLPKKTGFSKEMIELGLNEIRHLLSPDNIQKKMKAELGDIPRAPQFVYEAHARRCLHWQPLGSILHVLSGNVFLVGPSSVVEGAITGNATILKLSSGEQDFMPAFIRSIEEVEKELGLQGALSSTLALVDYSSGNKEALEGFKAQVDGVLVWGGEAAVQAYRDNLPANTKMIIYGPKLSICFVSDEGLRTLGAKAVAESIARELAIWDQAACTAPQMCVVESKEIADLLLSELPAALQAWQKTIPAGRLDDNEAAEIQKRRGTASMDALMGCGDLATPSSKDLSWTITSNPDPEGFEIETSPLHRTLEIRVSPDRETFLDRVAALKGYIQTVGLAVGPSEHLSLYQDLTANGALRVVPLGEMTGGEHDDPHDGARDLTLLMNLVYSRVHLPEGTRPFETLPKEKQNTIIGSKVEDALYRALKHSFYQRRVSDPSSLKLDNFPILGREDFIALEESVTGEAVASRPSLFDGGAITKTGGTTGTARYSYFNAEDWKKMIEVAAEAFLASGFLAGDRMANCMPTGELYGSFLSFNGVNERIGMVSFPFGGSPNAETFVDAWRRFRINAIQGMPPLLLPLLREAKRIEPELKIEKLMYAGMAMNPSDIEFLRSEIGTTTVVSMIGTTEVGLLAFQTADLEGRVHRTLDEHNFTEILDENDRPVADGEVGRIVVTSLSKPGVPVIRFDIGDKGRRITTDKLGSFIEYLGRGDDTVTLAMMNIHIPDVMKALTGLPYAEHQIVTSFSGASETFELMLEVDSPSESLDKEIEGKILNSVPGFKKNLKEGHLKVKVSTLPFGKIERNPRTGKIPRIVDRRFEEK